MKGVYLGRRFERDVPSRRFYRQMFGLRCC